MNQWKIILLSAFVNALIWCLPLSIITWIYTGCYSVGWLMGTLCFIVTGPRFNIGESIIKSCTCR